MLCGRNVDEYSSENAQKLAEVLGPLVKTLHKSRGYIKDQKSRPAMDIVGPFKHHEHLCFGMDPEANEAKAQAYIKEVKDIIAATLEE
ncbi:hypothetical protein CLAFUW4_13322 [Fulvia fulva]|uniref:Uncharacterized protein n=1 Tax=Passalora fulva TaxID=5499 RepID=A0A9Q8PK35_PASFU|nr:uncharacterized protein CLAFUR5_13177 [Fulvia fulva]KAK4612014.1 hypothetical protein CLAFUR4_13327 [Fulvia fulva]KAK4613076.1 hypothetical protein CLAFUR0_13332 [Fulvia fulva]UJO24104.1 hypothetical protein CLAFUR5_13177 [Fulvia fulva]WPV21301.1 hypothetical protein CLAFUW4_13322 [Fulvia fulva]WPV36410.1 hypothetical protein CLAFUW7_13329 [Fulvia fulva]